MRKRSSTWDSHTNRAKACRRIPSKLSSGIARVRSRGMQEHRVTWGLHTNTAKVGSKWMLRGTTPEKADRTSQKEEPSTSEFRE